MNTTLRQARPQNSIARAARAAIPPIKRVVLLAAAVWLAGPLAGCDSGGGGGNTTPAPVAADPAPGPVPGPVPGRGPGGLAAGSYLVAGTSNSEATGHSVLVADAGATPAAAVLIVPVQAVPTLMSTTGYTDDAATRSVFIHGAPLTFFVNGGQLWQIDLAHSRTPSRLRISSVSDACEPTVVAPLDLSGLDAWVLVSTAGPDGDCLAATDNRQAFVRSGTPATQAPVIVPATTQVQQLYLSGTGTGTGVALWWMFAIDRSGPVSRLVAYGRNLEVVEVTGGSGVRALNMRGQGADAADGIYLRTDDVLRRVEASATALRIGDPQLRFAGASPSATLYDRPAMYFTDLDIVYRVEGTAPAIQLARPNPGAASTNLLAQTANALLTRQEGGGGGGAVTAIDKRTGAATSLLAQPGDGSNAVWAVRGTTLFYFTGPVARVGALRRVEVDGTDDALVVTNLLMVGRVSSRVWDKGRSTLIGGSSALLACQPLPGNADCRGSTLIQIDVPSRAVTVLGSFGNSSATGWLAQDGTAYEGVKGAVIEVSSNLRPGGYTRKDLYVFNPGEANSLKQISPTTP